MRSFVDGLDEVFCSFYLNFFFGGMFRFGGLFMKKFGIGDGIGKIGVGDGDGDGDGLNDGFGDGDGDGVGNWGVIFGVVLLNLMYILMIVFYGMLKVNGLRGYWIKGGFDMIFMDVG